MQFSEAHMWAVLSAPVIAWFACRAAARDTQAEHVWLTATHDRVALGLSVLAVTLGAWTARNGIEAVGAMLFLAGLAYLADFDRRVMAVPVWIVIAMTFLGLLIATLEGGAMVGLAHLAAACGGWAGFRALDLAYLKVRGRSGLGSGDALLAAMIGAWLAAPGLAWAVAIGCAAALIWAILRGFARDRAFALAPALAAGAFFVVIGERFV